MCSETALNGLYPKDIAHLKTIPLPSPCVASAFLGVALFAVTAGAQAPPADGEHHHPPAPAPTNLKVLPKTLTGDQVHEIMHHWAGDLGVECNTCHVEDPVKKMPNGHPALDFPNDSKKEKDAARLMVKMTAEINSNYTSMVESSHDNGESAKKVTCGTCHRGHLDPPAYVAPKEHEHEHHDAPPAQPPVPR
jgi:Photosynthetic reaction centre cytochrome C subunit